ncbi:helix-turn-helix transcriptional regulator [Burkholderia glumae]|uniref:DNA binding protein n=1 Tax=Burkholderia glumae TaxID=337 RepID=Q4VSJ7_BURGL|nr:helix-turn-helix transcriptional regulator [Burkholderia glumae]AAV52815.1 DNA binding protein [Burkholderia glumae BGR1]ACR31069.1 LuxR family transcriptional regulator [Burkholderia glumae BGR1]AJY62635.1 bacterial regulatory s, luxR family protein [Burkholderia glumae LMG 2196 = ATCC 33617]KHJ64797.1 LuxR family transcriptional regulator [Burkholderia glumae]MCM2483607.1 LuxR C-terminal-related transcriptional regulator [Burkholderia glumae]
MVEIFGKLGKIISSTGTERFTSDLHALLVGSVNVESTRITAWSVNEVKGEIVGVHLLGAFASHDQDIRPNQAPPPAVLKDELYRGMAEDPLSKRILAASDTQLIHMNTARPGEGAFDAIQPGRLGFQCHLVSRKANRRYVISLYRPDQAYDFTLQEMTFLKSCAEILMPLVEMHASHRRYAMPGRPAASADSAGDSSTRHESLRREFERRLTSASVVLSEREIEVCVGLLTGSTFREMADALGVKHSTIETYIKRAAAKLGFKGRHGLVKWVLDES